MKMMQNWMKAANEIKNLELKAQAAERNGNIEATLTLTRKIWEIAMTHDCRIKGLLRALNGRGTPKAINAIMRCMHCFEVVIDDTVARKDRLEGVQG